MNRYNKLKLETLSAFARANGEWLKPDLVAERLDFEPRRKTAVEIWAAGKALLGQRYIGVQQATPPAAPGAL